MLPVPLVQSKNGLNAPEDTPPRPKSDPQHQKHLTPIKNTQASSSWRLVLKKILGITTTSPRGFDHVHNVSSFAACAGSAAVVIHVDQEFKVTQRYFRARPNALPVNKTLSYYDEPLTPSKTEVRSRLFSSVRAVNHGNRSTASPLVERMTTFSGNLVLQKTRAITCVSLSSDGKLLAVGEVGYNPRIMIFSTTATDGDVPLACFTEHAFGVRCLAFSHDMRWLCSVGDIQDGFVYLWAINAKSGSARLHSSNKCTNIVHGVTWLGNSFVTIGTRHVKVWRVEPAPATSPSKTKFTQERLELSVPSSPAPKIISGRNCLLGRLMEATFTCIAAIDDGKAILCTNKGDICILDDEHGTQDLYGIHRVQFDIRSVAIDHSDKLVWLGGKAGEVRAIVLDELLTKSKRPLETSQPHGSPNRAQILSSCMYESFNRPNPTSSPAIVALALGSTPKVLLTVDSNRLVHFYHTRKDQRIIETNNSIQVLRSHSGPALGVGLLYQSSGLLSGFFTWSATTVTTWTREGRFIGATEIDLEQPEVKDDGELNELKVVKASQYGDYIVSGDKIGRLRLLEGPRWKEAATINAHNGEINDIIIARRSEDISLVMSCGRDRTIQIFLHRSSQLDILQTIDQHLSTVNQILCNDDGSHLLSSSSDRTVVVHSLATLNDSIAYVVMHIITLKTSPISISLVPNDFSALLITTLDKQIHHYAIPSCQHIRSLRVTDIENNEPVLLDDLIVLDMKSPGCMVRVMFGFQAADKTIRIHDYETGATLSKEYGHSEGISSIAFAQYCSENGYLQNSLITTGMDGTIMLFDVACDLKEHANRISVAFTSQETPKSLDTKPLRRVLSRLTISEYQKSLDTNGITGLPDNPSTLQSPSRCRKSPSKPTLASLTTRNTTTTPSNPKLGTSTWKSFQHGSPTRPSPPVVQCLRTERRRCSLERHQTRSLTNLDDITATAEQLCKNLRACRKKLSVTSIDALKTDVAKELEEELGLTLRAVGQRTRRYQAASETMVGNLLDQYSEKLTQLVEAKIAIGIANKTPNGPLLDSSAQDSEADPGTTLNGNE